MPADQPSNAPQKDAPQPHDDLTAAAVLSDDSLDQPAGGGGMGRRNGPVGADAAGQTGGAPRTARPTPSFP